MVYGESAHVRGHHHENETAVGKKISAASTNMERAVTRKTDLVWGILGEILFNFGGGYLLSQAPFPGGVYPAGAAFFLARGQAAFWQKLLIMCGVFIGSAIVGNVFFALVLSGSLLPVFFLERTRFLKKNSGTANVFYALLWGCGYFLFCGFWGGETAGLWNRLLEIALGVILSFIIPIGLRSFKTPIPSVKENPRFSLFVLILITAMALSGAKRLTVFSFGLTDIGAILIILTAVYVGGEGVGAMMGIAVAAFLGITAGGLATLIALYGTAGLLAGAFRRLGRIGIIGGAAAGILFILQQLNYSPALVHHVIPWGIGMASFLIIPKRSFAPIIPYFTPGDAGKNKTAEEYQLREVFLNRLNDLAGIFAELAKSFHESAPAEQRAARTDLYALIDQVCLKNCQHCQGYQNCWGENFYVTYRELFDLIALAELYGEVKSEHIKGRLAKSCFQQYRLLTTINHLLERNQADIAWQYKLNESKSFLTNQLQGVSDMIADLAVEIETDSSFKTEMEEKIRHSFNMIGLSAKEVMILAFGEQKLEIRIKQRSCNRKRECQQLAAPLVSGIMGQDYYVWEKRCHQSDGNCSYCLTPERCFAVKTAVGKISKSEDNSGDSHLLQEMKDGHFMAILSDGMGHGNKAALESNTSVSILEKLIKSGMSHDFALRTVNSVLLLHSPEESFATIDLAFINLYNARAEFVKIGAAISYVKRGRDVWEIQSTSLPAGILNSVEPERSSLQLQANDFVIMVTDGISDSAANPAGKEDWVAKALRQVEVVGPEALAEYLLNMAKSHQNGIIKDDMTVIVFQITER